MAKNLNQISTSWGTIERLVDEGIQIPHHYTASTYKQ